MSRLPIMMRDTALVLSAMAIAACATAKKPDYLTQAEAIYQSLESRGGNETVEAEMI